MTFLQRRRLLQLAVLPVFVGQNTFAQNPTDASTEKTSTPQTNLSFTEVVSYATVKLRSSQATGSHKEGTGFIFQFFRNGKYSVPAIITNKHVVQSTESISGVLTLQKPDGGPDTGNTQPFTISNVSQLTVPHPNPAVDLAAIIFAPTINDFVSRSVSVYFSSFDNSVIWDEARLKTLTPVEDILIVGYPAGLIDRKSSLPIYRRGITATPAYADYDGEKAFLIDAAIWPGSSGSPVILYNEGSYSDARQHNLMIGGRYALLGVVSATFMQDIYGKVFAQPAPTAPTLPVPNTVVDVQSPNNLGICVNSSCILDFEPVMARLGIPVPPGYQMRSQMKL